METVASKKPNRPLQTRENFTMSPEDKKNVESLAVIMRCNKSEAVRRAVRDRLYQERIAERKKRDALENKS